VLNRDVPEWLDAVVLKAMRKEPAQRYASMRDFGKALAGGSESAAHSSGEHETHAADAHATHGISPMVLAVGALALAVMGGLVVYLAFG
jgi:hypothetical protein